MATKAVLFDLDDTLAPEETAVEAAFLATCEIAHRRHGIEPGALHEAIRREARELWRGFPTSPYCQALGMSSWEGLSADFLGDDPNLRELRARTPSFRLDAWSRALAKHGISNASLVEELATTFPQERRRQHTLFPGVETALTELRANFTLGMVTNGPPDLQREKIEATRLAPYFRAVIISGEVGIGKPDPRIFALALEKVATRPEEAVMVGNSLSRDVVGAQEAGLKAVWINRAGNDREDDDVTPDAVITSLSQLGDALRALADESSDI
ncbi:MAG: HAD family hydrolase [Dehalococcoidia bacterium]